MNGHSYICCMINGQGQRTWLDVCADAGKIPDSVGRQYRRKFPERTWSRTAVPQPDEYAVLIAGQASEMVAGADKPAIVVHTKKPRIKRKEDVNPIQLTTPPAAADTEDSVSSAGVKLDGRTVALYVLMAIPALASIQNMHAVSFDIVESEFAAALFTGLFSAAPFLFVLAGIRSGWTKALTALLIVYECFCNFTRIFGGLTGYEKTGNPTRFLGLVTDVFNSGTHQTGIVVAALMAAMAALIFYAAFNEIGK